jgi:hypothetical protein
MPVDQLHGSPLSKSLPALFWQVAAALPSVIGGAGLGFHPDLGQSGGLCTSPTSKPEISKESAR